MKKNGTYNWKVLYNVFSVLGFLLFIAALVNFFRQESIGDYVYIEYNKTKILHAKRTCCENVHFIKTSELYIYFGEIHLFCSKCVSDSQYENLIRINEAQKRNLEYKQD